MLRESLAPPELFVHLCADEGTVMRRLSGRERINIARAEDTALFHALVKEWLDSVPRERVLELDVTDETLGYERSMQAILDKLARAE